MSLSKILGFYPDNLEIYAQALLHKSSSEKTDDGKRINNERLEFLGDAILDAVVTDIVYRRFPNRREGFLTSTRSKIVQRDMLNKIAERIGLDKVVIYSTKVHYHHNNFMYGNALEALVGAIYIDQGYDVCYEFVRDVIIKKNLNIDKVAKEMVNFKSSLIEWGQKHKLEVSFFLLESFSDHEGNQFFQSEVRLLGRQIGVGTGYSKKESQQTAAKEALEKLRTDSELKLFINDVKKTREMRRIACEQIKEEASNADLPKGEPGDGQENNPTDKADPMP